jgi:PIN domain nuclease of toxin-antitoxin system
MSYLLDTHVLIFLGCGEIDRVGKKALGIYQNPDSRIFVSQMSFWEIAIKVNIDKLHIPIGLQNVIVQSQLAGIETISIQNSHILYYQSLEVKGAHKDPFDRFLVSTALCEDLKILSSDGKFDLYEPVTRIWD